MSNTMAEPFCEEHLITWTEHGQDFTDWQRKREKITNATGLVTKSGAERKANNRKALVQASCLSTSPN